MAVLNEPWEQWERTRKMGRTQYIVVYGLFGWGLSMALLCALAVCAASFYVRAELPHFGVILSIGLVPLIGGWIWGAVTWFSTERDYFAAKERARLGERLQHLEHEVNELREALSESKVANLDENHIEQH